MLIYRYDVSPSEHGDMWKRVTDGGTTIKDLCRPFEATKLSQPPKLVVAHIRDVSPEDLSGFIQAGFNVFGFSAGTPWKGVDQTIRTSMAAYMGVQFKYFDREEEVVVELTDRQSLYTQEALEKILNELYEMIGKGKTQAEMISLRERLLGRLNRQCL